MQWKNGSIWCPLIPLIYTSYLSTIVWCKWILFRATNFHFQLGTIGQVVKNVTPLGKLYELKLHYHSSIVCRLLFGGASINPKKQKKAHVWGIVKRSWLTNWTDLFTMAFQRELWSHHVNSHLVIKSYYFVFWLIRVPTSDSLVPTLGVNRK